MLTNNRTGYFLINNNEMLGPCDWIICDFVIWLKYILLKQIKNFRKKNLKRHDKKKEVPAMF